jgi:predicted dehydrogenase
MGASIDDELPPDLAAWRPMSHAAALDAHPTIDLVGVCGRSVERVENARRRHGVARGYLDVDRMLAAERPDVLSIATPADTHAWIVEAAAEAGVRGIYCEKPLAPSLAEADRIVAACRRHDVKLNYGVQRRYMEPHMTLRRALAEGRLGQTEAIAVTSWPSPALAMHSHSVDLLSFLAGDTPWVTVRATLELVESSTGFEDPLVRSAHLRFANGVEGRIETGVGYEVEVRTDEAVVQIADNGTRAVLRRASAERPFDHPPIASGTLAGIDDLVRAIAENRATAGPVEIALRGLEALFAMVESERRGGAAVEGPPVDRSVRVDVA